MANTGDIRTLKLDGVAYPVTGGSDFSEKLGDFQKESVPTSGTPDVKFTKQNQDVEGVDVSASGARKENIIDLSNRTDDFDIVYTAPDGTVRMSEGQITITGASTQDGKLTLTLIPTSDWTPIVV